MACVKYTTARFILLQTGLTFITKFNLLIKVLPSIRPWQNFMFKTTRLIKAH